MGARSYLFAPHHNVAKLVSKKQRPNKHRIGGKRQKQALAQAQRKQLTGQSASPVVEAVEEEAMGVGPIP